MKTMRDFMVSNARTMAGIQAHMQESAEGSTRHGQYFGRGQERRFLLLPPEVFQNPDFSAA